MTETEITLHPFERSGLGVGPFRCVGAVSIPSPSLAEHNTDAYNNAMRSLPRDVGCGTCAHCGMAIMHNFIIESKDGKRFVVGSDCVHKTGAKSVGNKFLVEELRLKREARRTAKELKRKIMREKFLATICETGETNAVRIERERREATEKRESEVATKTAACLARWSFVLEVLDNATGSFCASVASEIRAGREPRGRAIDILRDIYGKAKGGRGGSKAFEAAAADFDAKVGPLT